MEVKLRVEFGSIVFVLAPSEFSLFFESLIVLAPTGAVEAHASESLHKTRLTTPIERDKVGGGGRGRRNTQELKSWTSQFPFVSRTLFSLPSSSSVPSTTTHTLCPEATSLFSTRFPPSHFPVDDHNLSLDAGGNEEEDALFCHVLHLHNIFSSSSFHLLRREAEEALDHQICEFSHSLFSMQEGPSSSPRPSSSLRELDLLPSSSPSLTSFSAPLSLAQLFLALVLNGIINLLR